MRAVFLLFFLLGCGPVPPPAEVPATERPLPEAGCAPLGAVAAPLPDPYFRDASGQYHYYRGRSFYVDGVHLGLDLAAPEGTPVFAGVHGTVQYYGPAAGYGRRVLVVESHMPGARTWQNGRGESVTTDRVVFLYGHLRASEKFGDDRGAEGDLVALQEGDCVTPETVIGYIERDSHNGDGAEHLHMGLRLQAWAEAEAAQAVQGWSSIGGYDRDGEMVRVYGDPEQLWDPGR